MARASRTRFAVCIDNSGYPASLELHKIYRVLPDKEAEEDGDIRIVDESGEDYLFEADRFCPCTCRRRPCVSSIARSPGSLL